MGPQTGQKVLSKEEQSGERDIISIKRTWISPGNKDLKREAELQYDCQKDSLRVYKWECWEANRLFRVSHEDASKGNRKATLRLRAEQPGFTAFMYFSYHLRIYSVEENRTTNPNTNALVFNKPNEARGLAGFLRAALRPSAMPSSSLKAGSRALG